MKIAIITDVHANLPALEAVLSATETEGVDLIVHLGDAVAIGPHPAQCLERLLSLPEKRLIMGNHDAYFAFGVPKPRPAYMSDGEAAHQEWTHAQLKPADREIVSGWHYVMHDTWEGVEVTLLHYGLTPDGKDFLPIMDDPTTEQLDEMFGEYQADVVFYGHHHPFADVIGATRYINPGSVGCQEKAFAPYSIITCTDGEYTVHHRRVPYDDSTIRADFIAQNVPQRQLLNHIFYGGRF